MKSDKYFTLMTIDEFEKWLFNSKFKRNIKTIQNHHTYSPSYKNFDGNNHFKLMLGMRNYHVNTKGWSDIAQHFSTFPDGTIVTGRNLNNDPAGILGFNKSSICIEHLGNFDKGQDVMTSKQKETILKLNYLLCKRFNIDINTNNIVYHHWFDLDLGKRINDKSGNTKSCPGSNFFGGNTVSAANSNFISLIKQAYSKPISKPSKPVSEDKIKELIELAFKDIDNVSNWAKPSVERLEKLGIFKGDEEGNFKAHDEVDRQELAVVIDRVLKLLGK